MITVLASLAYKWLSINYTISYSNHHIQLEYYKTVIEKYTFAGELLPFHDADQVEKFESEINFFAKRSKSMTKLQKEADAWLPIIQDILLSQNIPSDFKYLSVVESNLIPTALSNKGAAGVWQITEPTGKELGLVINEEIDERYDIYKATYAACRYFKRAYKRLGNWTDVAVSYNIGINGLHKRKVEQKQSSFYDLERINRETSRYIYKIYAMKEILEKPEVYGLSARKGYLPHTRNIVVKEDIPNLIAFAYEHKCSYTTLRDLNPWLRSDALHFEGTKRDKYVIKLPRYVDKSFNEEQAEDFLNNVIIEEDSLTIKSDSNAIPIADSNNIDSIN